MWSGRQRGQPAGLQQRLLISCACTRAARGRALLEWTVATGLGMMLVAAAVWLFSQQGQLMKSLFSGQAQAQEYAAMAQVIRAELRVAGQRGQAGASSSHDTLLLDEGRAPFLQYLCDRCGSPDRARASGFRLQDGVIGHKSLGVTAHQSLNDPQTAAVRSWRVTQGQTHDCSPWLTLRWEGDPITQGARGEWMTTIRPRNLGLLDCEVAGANSPATAADTASSASPSRASGVR